MGLLLYITSERERSWCWPSNITTRTNISATILQFERAGLWKGVLVLGRMFYVQKSSVPNPLLADTILDEYYCNMCAVYSPWPWHCKLIEERDSLEGVDARYIEMKPQQMVGVRPVAVWCSGAGHAGGWRRSHHHTRTSRLVFGFPR
jgi:hypothetical protein